MALCALSPKCCARVLFRRRREKEEECWLANLFESELFRKVIPPQRCPEAGGGWWPRRTPSWRTSYGGPLSSVSPIKNTYLYQNTYHYLSHLSGFDCTTAATAASKLHISHILGGKKTPFPLVVKWSCSFLFHDPLPYSNAV